MARVDALLSWLPPSQQESLAVPVGAVRRWLSGEILQSFGDIDSEEFEQQGSESPGRSDSFVIRYGDGRCQWISTGQIKPGDTLVISARRGGADDFGWLPEWDNNKHRSVNDLAEQAQFERFIQQRVRRLSFRLQPDVLKQWMDLSEELSSRLDQLCGAIKKESSSQSLREEASAILEYLSETMEPTISNSLPIKHFLNRPFQVHLHPAGDGVILVLGRELLMDDSQDMASHSQPVALQDHLLGVEQEIQHLAAQCGLSDELASTLALAGKYHDIGKADPRFQILLHGGDALAAAQGEVLAKSGINPSDRGAMKNAYERSGLPKGFRHELLSVAALQGNRQLEINDRELVEYLVGTHHGSCRPLPPFIEDNTEDCHHLALFEQPFPIMSQHNLHHIGSGWVDNFWLQVHRFDWWTLAYLEAIVRLGDWARSRKEVEE